jgi:dissimilatory sulfite reductase (desulfoviridin) alpha/beta subunit
LRASGHKPAITGEAERHFLMKKIEAIIKPFKLDEVKEALQEVGLQGSLSPKPKALDARRATRNCTVARNTSLIFSPR